MPGFVVQQSATVLCAHGGQGTATVPNPRITQQGMQSSVISSPWLVGGCPGVPAASIPPCVTAQWVTGSTRVTSNGQPLVIMSSSSTAVPPGTPLMPLVTQTRVTVI